MLRLILAILTFGGSEVLGKKRNVQSPIRRFAIHMNLCIFDLPRGDQLEKLLAKYFSEKELLYFSTRPRFIERFLFFESKKTAEEFKKSLLKIVPKSGAKRLAHCHVGDVGEERIFLPTHEKYFFLEEINWCNTCDFYGVATEEDHSREARCYQCGSLVLFPSMLTEKEKVAYVQSYQSGEYPPKIPKRVAKRLGFAKNVDERDEPIVKLDDNF